MTMLALLVLAAIAPDPDALRCAVRPGVVDIILPAALDPRIGSMAVVKGRKWAVLADERVHLVPFRSGVRRLSLRSSRQLGMIDGRATRAFPHPGTYRIVFSDNLETEPENMIALDCVVRVR